MKDFLIFTYCTDVDNQVYKKLSSQLEITLLPILLPWSWDFYPKSYSLLENIKLVPPETIVLVCDSYDVLPIPNLTNEGLFSAIKHNFNLDKITFNAEKNCYPNIDLVDLYPRIKSEWKYLNAGIYVGKAGNILTMLESLLPKIKYTIDQEIFSIAYINNQNNIDIDYKCKVFQTLYMLSEDDLTIDGYKIINNKTNSSPVLIHGNGKSNLENLKLWN